MNEIIIAIIGGLCVGIPSVVATIFSNNKSNAVMLYRVDQLDKKVEKHNQVIERMAVVENSLKTAHHRIDDLQDR